MEASATDGAVIWQIRPALVASGRHGQAGIVCSDAHQDHVVAHPAQLVAGVVVAR